jgi:hypothetical protein
LLEKLELERKQQSLVSASGRHGCGGSGWSDGIVRGHVLDRL